MAKRNYFKYSDNPEPQLMSFEKVVNDLEYSTFLELLERYGPSAKFYVSVDYNEEKTFYLYDERFETDEEVKQRLENAKKERNLAKQEAARKRRETLEKKKKEQDLEYVTYLKLKEKFENK